MIEPIPNNVTTDDANDTTAVRFVRLAVLLGDVMVSNLAFPRVGVGT
jgi:hypothetical protein